MMLLFDPHMFSFTCKQRYTGNIKLTAVAGDEPQGDHSIDQRVHHAFECVRVVRGQHVALPSSATPMEGRRVLRVL